MALTRRTGFSSTRETIKTMNVLVTSIGSFSGTTVVSRLSLDPSVTIHTCNSIEIENTGYPVPIHIVPHSSDGQSYLSEIVDLCRDLLIDAVIPLTDPEVDLFNDSRALFSDLGIKLLIPNSEFVRIGRNKKWMSEFFERIETVYPIPTLDLGKVTNADLPIIMKPLNGRSSQGIVRLNSDHDLAATCPDQADMYVTQPFIEGSVWVADIMKRSSASDLLIGCRKELSRTSNGRGISVLSQDNPEIERQCGIICRELRFRGVANIEFMESNGRFFLMDINPRFSAGIAHSQNQGRDIIGACLNHLKNMKISNESY